MFLVFFLVSQLSASSHQHRFCSTAGSFVAPPSGKRERKKRKRSFRISGRHPNADQTTVAKVLVEQKRPEWGVGDEGRGEGTLASKPLSRSCGPQLSLILHGAISWSEQSATRSGCSGGCVEAPSCPWCLKAEANAAVVMATESQAAAVVIL